LSKPSDWLCFTEEINMSIQDEAVKTAMVRFGLVKEAGVGQYLAGKSLGEYSKRMGALAGALGGSALGGVVGAGVGAYRAEPGERLEGALKGGLGGAVVGGATGGVAGRFGLPASLTHILRNRGIAGEVGDKANNAYQNLRNSRALLQMGG
jgi:hypothetical protein